MDRLKNIGNSVRAKVPGQEQKPSYAGFSDSRPAAKNDDGTLGKVKGFVPDRVTGLVRRSTETEEAPRPAPALKDLSTFAPPPRHRAAHGDASFERPPLPRRGLTAAESPESRRPPPMPPRLPPRTGTAASLPESRNVTEDDIASRGGLSTGAVGALGRLGNSGIRIPGFETAQASSPPPPPATGTSFAEKKAAVRTANAFYKDPSKVSLADARSAAGTARNFQQRHGDRVVEAAGVAKSYGVLGPQTSSPPPPPDQSRPSPPPPPPPPPLPPPRVQKKPPPPPPPLKKKPPPPAPPPARSSPPPLVPSRPPAVPRHTRPAPAPSPVHQHGCSLPNSGYPQHLLPELPSDLDLCLRSEWFTTNPVRLPPSIQDNPNKSLRYSTSWVRNAAGRTKHTLVIAVLWTTNLSSTKIRLTWDASAPAATVQCTQRHFPPPPALSSSELAALAAIGPEVVQWCRDRMGTQVGNGECWTLAHEALRATPGVMESQQTSHGACILSHYAPSPVAECGVDIAAGDILQFWRAKWSFPNGSWKTAGDPDHTAVVTAALRQPNGTWVCQVLEQNVGGVKRVMTGEYSIGQHSGMGEGAVRAFRPAHEGWAHLDSEWGP